MARPNKKGLEYFPLDVDIFQDIKIRKLIRAHHIEALSIYLNILCRIYKEGYYIKYDSEFTFIISESTGNKEDYIKEVIHSCLNIGLFSLKMFKEGQVLTSKSIQDRYFLICWNAKRKFVTDYLLINPQEVPINFNNKKETKIKIDKVVLIK